MFGNYPFALVSRTRGNQNVPNQRRPVATTTRHYVISLNNASYPLTITNVPTTAVVSFELIPDGGSVAPPPLLYRDPVVVDPTSHLQTVVMNQPNAPTSIYRDRGIPHFADYESSILTQHRVAVDGYHRAGQHSRRGQRGGRGQHGVRANMVSNRRDQSTNQHVGGGLNRGQINGQQWNNEAVVTDSPIYGYRRPSVIHRSTIGSNPVFPSLTRISAANRGQAHHGSRSNTFTVSGQRYPRGYRNGYRNTNNTVPNNYGDNIFRTFRPAQLRSHPAVMYSEMCRNNMTAPFPRTSAFQELTQLNTFKQSFYHLNRLLQYSVNGLTNMGSEWQYRRSNVVDGQSGLGELSQGSLQRANTVQTHSDHSANQNVRQFRGLDSNQAVALQQSVRRDSTEDLTTQQAVQPTIQQAIDTVLQHVMQSSAIRSAEEYDPNLNK